MIPTGVNTIQGALGRRSRGPIHLPPGGFPIRRIRRMLADDRIGRIRIDPLL